VSSIQHHPIFTLRSRCDREVTVPVKQRKKQDRLAPNLDHRASQDRVCRISHSKALQPQAERGKMG